MHFPHHQWNCPYIHRFIQTFLHVLFVVRSMIIELEPIEAQKTACFHVWRSVCSLVEKRYTEGRKLSILAKICQLDIYDISVRILEILGMIGPIRALRVFSHCIFYIVNSLYWSAHPLSGCEVFNNIASNKICFQ